LAAEFRKWLLSGGKTLNLLMAEAKSTFSGKAAKAVLSEYPVTHWRCLNNLAAARLRVLSSQAPAEKTTSPDKPSVTSAESGESDPDSTSTRIS
jgi:hypothetical protein